LLKIDAERANRFVDVGLEYVTILPPTEGDKKAEERNRKAARRASGVLLTAPDVSPTKDAMIAREIQEMRDALQAFQTAIDAGEVAGFKNGSMHSYGGT
jgi:hypothetical protein